MYCQVSKVQTTSVHDSTPRKGPLSFSNLLSFRVCLHCRHVWHICNPSATVSPIQTKLTSFQEPWDTTTTAHTHTHTDQPSKNCAIQTPIMQFQPPAVERRGAKTGNKSLMPGPGNGKKINLATIHHGYHPWDCYINWMVHAVHVLPSTKNG